MEGQRIYRHCPEHHNSPCYNSTCEHQCFMEEKECREPEHRHHKECPVTTLPCPKKCPEYYCALEESKVTIQKVADLEAAINNDGQVTPELQAAFDALKAQVTLVDDLIPDAPTA